MGVTRREFLVASGLTAGAAVLFLLSEREKQRAYDSEFQVHYAKEVGFDEMAEFCWRLKPLVDRINESGWEPNLSEANLGNWVETIVPMFEYEELVIDPVYPERIEFQRWRDGQLHVHRTGVNFCGLKEIELSERFITPEDALYRSKRILGTLTHELGHLQQTRWGCKRLVDIPFKEVDAEMMKLEVMAALGIRGNREMALSLVISLMQMATNSALLLALRSDEDESDEMERFEQLRAAIYPRTVDSLQFEQFQERLVEHRFAVEDGLEVYYLEPYRLIVEAHRQHEDLVVNPHRPPLEKIETRGGRIYKNVIEFRVNDLVRFVREIEGVVEDYL